MAATHSTGDDSAVRAGALAEPGPGSPPAPPDERTALQDALRLTAVALTDAGIDFALVGGYAAWARGAPEPSHDADFAVAEQDADRAREAIAAAGLEVREPAENWLFKAFHHGAMVDVLFRMVGEPITAQMLARSDQIEVLAVRMPVLDATDILSAKMRVLGEHYCDFTRMLAIARALREQIDWHRVRAETAETPYGRAFLHLVHELGISPVGPAD
ncbi:nucleotidyltransferase family protein [Cellulomonas denverensis]|uniref:Nucleotidyltransferase family protein n=1 Tax=Cellulomonas denverensis TaxID=264297 RepID=A0A7X6KSA1_9CELL|nr:nucleotidyltransferase family protein [Cellulomonas denverensis]NKY21351.1 nucleotidyltransferase family protein [Cellulomonas denverensis]